MINKFAFLLTLFPIMATADSNIRTFTNDKSDATEVILFLHGFLGNSEETWTNTDSNFFFPKEMAKEEEFKNIPVLSFEYPAACHAVTSRDAARKLYQELSDRYVNLKKISIVAHSFGGVVAREFILQTKNVYKTEMLVTLAVPNLGSAFSSYQKYVKKHCDLRTLNDLNPDRGGYIDGLNDSWSKDMEQISGMRRDFEICAAFENLPTFDFYFWDALIVPKDSAIMYSQSSLFFNTNHIGIAKPLGKTDYIFSWVKNRLLSKKCIRDNKILESSEYLEKVNNGMKFIAKTYGRKSYPFLIDLSNRNIAAAKKSLSTLEGSGSKALGSALIHVVNSDIEGAKPLFKKAYETNVKYRLEVNASEKQIPFGGGGPQSPEKSMKNRP